MKQITSLLFLYITSQASTTQQQNSYQYVKLNECAIDYRSPENTLEQLLQEKIMFNYTKEVPPRPPYSTCTDVKLQFLISSPQVNDIQEFSVYSWIYIDWTDERLEWGPTSYKGISEINVNGLSIWRPDIRHLNSISDKYAIFMDKYDSLPCEVSSNGLVRCTSRATFQSKCSTDLKDWPYDMQVCSLQFGVRSHAQRINLMFSDTFIFLVSSKNSVEWIMVDYKLEENEDEDRQLKIYFTMVRHAKNLAAFVIYPSLLITLLTISTLLLDVRCVIRLYMACFSLMCHFCFLTEIGMNIPNHGRNVPRILLYFRGSIIITVTSILVTFILNLLCHRHSTVPRYIAIANEKTYNTYARFVIYPRWETASLDNGKVVKEWTCFANILNSVWIYSSVMVYVIMYCVFVPSISVLEPITLVFMFND